MNKYISVVYRESNFENGYMSGEMLHSKLQMVEADNEEECVEKTAYVAHLFEASNNPDGGYHDTDIVVIHNGQIVINHNYVVVEGYTDLLHKIWDEEIALRVESARKEEAAKAEAEARRLRNKAEDEIRLRNQLLEKHPL